jgi:hypothetical protein
MVQIIRISRDGNSTGLVLWGTIEMNVGVCNLTPLESITTQANTKQDLFDLSPLPNPTF